MVASDSSKRRILLYTAVAIVTVTATAVRVAPWVEGGERLQRQCVSEDGYLMLTIVTVHIGERDWLISQR